MGFFANLVQPREFIIDKLNDYLDDDVVDKKCKIWTAMAFLMPAIPMSCWLFYLGAPIIYAITDGLKVGLSFVIFWWVNVLVTTSVAAKLGGDDEPKMYLLGGLVWTPYLLLWGLIINAPLLVLGFYTPELMTFIAKPVFILNTLLFMVAILAPASASQSISIVRSFASILLSIIISPFVYLIVAKVIM